MCVCACVRACMCVVHISVEDNSLIQEVTFLETPESHVELTSTLARDIEGSASFVLFLLSE